MHDLGAGAIAPRNPAEISKKKVQMSAKRRGAILRRDSTIGTAFLFRARQNPAILLQSHSEVRMLLSDFITNIAALGRFELGSEPFEDTKRLLCRNGFEDLSNQRYHAFKFLAAAPFEDAFAFMRGLTICETLKLSPFPGSVSLVNPAFFVVRERAVEEWTAIADWIITHSENPYIPFNYQATRSAWLARRAACSSPIDTWEAVCGQKSAEEQMKAERAKVHAERMRQQEEAAVERRIWRHKECEANRVLSAAHTPVRENHLAELNKKRPWERLRVIARDTVHKVGYYPPEYAIVSDDDICALDDETILLLRERLADRRGSPWRELYQRLMTITIADGDPATATIQESSPFAYTPKAHWSTLKPPPRSPSVDENQPASQFIFAACRKCGYHFKAVYGPRMAGNVYHCETCGSERLVSWEKSLPPGQRCDCGGSFSLNAPPRCPKCRSMEFDNPSGIIGHW